MMDFIDFGSHGVPVDDVRGMEQTPDFYSPYCSSSNHRKLPLVGIEWLLETRLGKTV